MLIMARPAICSDLWEVWQIIGWVLWIFKIVIPIVIILFGMIDLGKAVVASKDDEIKKSVKSLVMRAIAGVIIFFIPTIIGLIFGIVGDFSEVEAEYNICRSCITNPGGCEAAAQEGCTQLGGTWSDGTCINVPDNANE